MKTIMFFIVFLLGISNLLIANNEKTTPANNCQEFQQKKNVSSPVFYNSIIFRSTHRIIEFVKEHKTLNLFQNSWNKNIQIVTQSILEVLPERRRAVENYKRNVLITKKISQKTIWYF